MNDPIDVYVSRSLKNWAAQQYPDANRRALLLEEAAVPTPIPHQNDRPFSVAALFRLDNRPGLGSIWASGPLTQTRSWSFHLVTSLRTVA